MPTSNPETIALNQPRLPVTLGSIEEFANDPVLQMRRLWARHGEVCALQQDSQRLHFVFGPEYTRQVLSDEQRFHALFFAVRGPRKSACSGGSLLAC
ncbi:MAG: hypothetical protein R3B90_13195 [Planctomycetaceae bacterium]